MELVIIASGIAAIGLIWLIFAWYRHSRKYRWNPYITPPSPYKPKASVFWHFISRLWSSSASDNSIQLPNVNRYGGNLDLKRPAIIATEYPRGDVVNVQHLADIPHYPYTSREFLTIAQASEHNLYFALQQLFQASNYCVFNQVPLSSLLEAQPTLTPQDWQKADERLQQKKVDFVICQRPNLQIKGVILLDYNLEDGKSLRSQIQDKFIELALNKVNIPVIYQTLQTHYDKKVLQTNLQTLNLIFNDSKKINSQQRLCPQCGSAMRKMQAKKGQQAGNYFWVCQKYPACATVLKIKTEK